MLQKRMKHGHNGSEQYECAGLEPQHLCQIHYPHGYAGRYQGICNAQPDEDNEKNDRDVQQNGTEVTTAGYKIQASVAARYVHG